MSVSSKFFQPISGVLETFLACGVNVFGNSFAVICKSGAQNTAELRDFFAAISVSFATSLPPTPCLLGWQINAGKMFFQVNF
jgi:hypothetical protein